METMAATLHATVVRGRLVVEESTDLPEGSRVSRVVADGDSLTEAERAELYSELDQSLAEAKAGRTRPVADILAVLRSG